MVKSVYKFSDLGDAITPELLVNPSVRKVLTIQVADQELKSAQAKGHFKRGEFKTVVDGSPTRFVQRVRAGGRISFVDTRTSFVQDAYSFALDKLLDYSPTYKAVYRSSFATFAIPKGAKSSNLGGFSPVSKRSISLPNDLGEDSALIVQKTPYAGKIERGYSDQAKGGVFRRVYRDLVAKFGDNISVSFFYTQGFAQYKGRFYSAPSLLIGAAGDFRTRATNPNSKANTRRRNNLRR